MNLMYRLIVLCALAAQAVAQDSVPTQVSAPEQADPTAQREKRRMALRTALKPQHQTTSAGEQRKQLTQQERSELRQHVRQQQDPAKRQP
jgi:hypothetical protein